MYKKGFTLIELLVAFLILTFIMIGFLRGVLTYIQFSLHTRLKDQASILLGQWTGYLNSLPYQTIQAITQNFNYPNGWNNVNCGVNTSFENADVDADGIPDFYDPYNGNNNNFFNNQQNFAPWLFASPRNNPFLNSPPLQVQVGSRLVRVGITVAICRNQQNADVGRVFGVVAWYFSPIDNRYRSVNGIVVRAP